MGLDLTIRFAAAPAPGWDEIRTHLARVGESAPLRMIDGLPAFPDDVPEPTWREVRIGTAAGMVTVRRGPDSLTCVVWGNAGPDLLAARDRVAWACAAAGGGTVEAPAGPLQAAEFARSAGISPV